MSVGLHGFCSLVLLMTFFNVANFCDAVRLADCINGKVTIAETAPSTILTCTDIGPGETVAWLLSKGSGQAVNLGTCPPVGTACQVSNRYSLSRTDVTTTLTIAASDYQRTLLGGYTLVCNIQGQIAKVDSCPIDVVYPSEASCSVWAESGTWRLKAFCNITNTFSTLGSYSCNAKDPPQQTLYTPTFLAGAQYGTGSCSFQWSMPNEPVSGVVQQYQFHISPTAVSNNYSISLSVGLERPDFPVVTCPNIIAENSSLGCNCSTRNIGYPSGRLVWKLDGTSGILLQGSYNVTSLFLTSKVLTRYDNGTNFTCSLEWRTGFLTQSFTVKVGYPPTTVNFTINSMTSSNVTLKQDGNISIYCLPQDGYPLPSIILTGPVAAPLSQGSAAAVITERWSHVRCDWSGMYSCTAQNQYGPSVSSQTFVWITCPPTVQEVSELHVNFSGDPISVTFDVIAVPAPELWIFDRSPANESAENGQLDIFTGCTASLERIYQFTCSLNVIKISQSTSIRVIINNTEGNWTTSVFLNYLSTGQVESEGSLGIILGVTIAGAAVLVIAIVVICRRRRRLLGRHTKSYTEANSNNSQMLENERESGPRSTILASSPVYENAAQEGNEITGHSGPYDQLQMTEIGLRSEYDCIVQTANETQRRTESAYEGLHISDIGLKSVYSQLGTPKRSTHNRTNDGTYND